MFLMRSHATPRRRANRAKGEKRDARPEGKTMKKGGEKLANNLIFFSIKEVRKGN